LEKMDAAPAYPTVVTSVHLELKIFRQARPKLRSLDRRCPRVQNKG